MTLVRHPTMHQISLLLLLVDEHGCFRWMLRCAKNICKCGPICKIKNFINRENFVTYVIQLYSYQPNNSTLQVFVESL